MTLNRTFDIIADIATLLYDNPKVHSYAKYVGFNVNNDNKDERNDYDLNSIKDLAQRITDSYRSNYFVFTGDHTIDPDNSEVPGGVTHLNPEYYLHSDSNFNFNRQWLGSGWYEKHKPGRGWDGPRMGTPATRHPDSSYFRRTAEKDELEVLNVFMKNILINMNVLKRMVKSKVGTTQKQ